MLGGNSFSDVQSSLVTTVPYCTALHCTLRRASRIAIETKNSDQDQDQNQSNPSNHAALGVHLPLPFHTYCTVGTTIHNYPEADDLAPARIPHIVAHGTALFPFQRPWTSHRASRTPARPLVQFRLVWGTLRGRH